MDIQNIIANLEAERDRLNSAIEALKGSRSGKARSGPARRRLSAAARKRISDAQKKRWAARKRGAA